MAILQEEMDGMSGKDLVRFSRKIEDAINELCLENYLNCPDYISGMMLANIFNEIVKQYQANELWHGNSDKCNNIKIDRVLPTIENKNTRSLK